MKKVFVSILILVTIFIFGNIFTDPVRAKVLPRFQATPKTSVGKRAPAGFSVSAKVRRDRRALILYFRNLQTVSSIFYSLSYQTNGKDEGVGGTIDPAGKASLNREILFGTCSSGACSYHSNIKNAKLEVTATLTSGKKIIRRFRIRI